MQTKSIILLEEIEAYKIKLKEYLYLKYITKGTEFNSTIKSIQKNINILNEQIYKLNNKEA